MEEVSVQVNIGGRVYPLTIDKAQESIIREAEQKLSASFEAFRQNYAVKDKQDLLAMAALQVVAALLTGAKEPSDQGIPVDEVKSALETLEKSVDTHLS
jgi:cell division protein ZapA